MRQLLSTVLIATAIEACGLLLPNAASALEMGFSSRTGNVYSYTLSLEANEGLVPGDSIDFINLFDVTEIALSSAGEPYFDASLDPAGTSASFTVTNSLIAAQTTTLNDVFSLTSRAASGDINISILASDPDIDPSEESEFITQGPSAAPTAVPFEFSPSQGIALGLPLFIGLRMLKKRRALKKSTREVQEIVRSRVNLSRDSGIVRAE